MKNNKKESNIGFIIIEIIFAIIFIYAAVQLYSIFSDYKRASDEYSVLAENVVTNPE